MYGAGIGGIFKALFRTALPLCVHYPLKRGFSIAKPHLKAAAKNIAKKYIITLR